MPGEFAVIKRKSLMVEKKLTEVCEKALDFFKCSSCGKGVWFADVGGSEWIYCQCGQIRWRYGKA